MEDFSTPYIPHSEEARAKDWKKLQSANESTTITCHARDGLKIIEHYQPHFWKVESPTGESIFKNWSNEDLRQKALERTQKHYTKIYKSEIRRNLAFFSKAPLPTIYRPLLVKGIVKHFNAKLILDPCIGWGGRVLGTLSIPDTKFIGCEPCLETYKGLKEMAAFVGCADRVSILNEDCLKALPRLESNSFDLVLTSPPYFDLEVYSKEVTQSISQFKTWDEWVKGFLEPTIKECLRCLKSEGVSAWSVKNMKKHKLQDEVFRIHKDLGWKHKETFGMTATPRNSGGKARITEETFIFTKN